MTEVKRSNKPRPFWLVCVLVLGCALILGNLANILFLRLLKGGLTWRELRAPQGERIMSLLDATITYEKEFRLCVSTERGAIYLWRRRYQAGRRIDPGGAEAREYWQSLKPLPDQQTIKYVIVSGFSANGKDPLVAVKSESGKTYAWYGDNWNPLERITVLGVDWPYGWPSDNNDETGSISLTHDILKTSHAPLSGRRKKLRQELHAWFTLPEPPSKVIDEINVSFEGALSDWVSSYVLLEDGRLFVLATERDLADVFIWLASEVVALFAALILLIIIRVRRTSAKTRSP